MAVKRVIEGVHVVPMGMANAFLVEGDDGLILIDAGYPGKEEAVFGAIRWLGRSPKELERLIFDSRPPRSISAAPPPSCGKPAPGLTCTRSISPWP